MNRKFLIGFFGFLLVIACFAFLMIDPFDFAESYYEFCEKNGMNFSKTGHCIDENSVLHIIGKKNGEFFLGEIQPEYDTFSKKDVFIEVIKDE